MKVSHIFTGIFLGLLFCSFFGATSCRKGNRRKKDHLEKRDGPLTSGIDGTARSNRVVQSGLRTDSEVDIKGNPPPLCESGDLDCLTKKSKKERKTIRRKANLNRHRISHQKTTKNRQDRQRSMKHTNVNKISSDERETHSSSSNTHNGEHRPRNRKKEKRKEASRRLADAQRPKNRKILADQQRERSHNHRKDDKNTYHTEKKSNRHKTNRRKTKSDEALSDKDQSDRREIDRKLSRKQGSSLTSQRNKYEASLASKRDHTERTSSTKADTSTRKSKIKEKDTSKSARKIDNSKSATSRGTGASLKINENAVHQEIVGNKTKNRDKKVDSKKRKTKSKHENKKANSKRKNKGSEQQNNGRRKGRVGGNGHSDMHSERKKSNDSPRSSPRHKSKKVSKASGRKEVSDNYHISDETPRGRSDRHNGRRRMDYSTRRFNARRNYDRRPAPRGRSRYAYDYYDDYEDYDYDYDTDYYEYDDYDQRPGRRGSSGDEKGKRRPPAGRRRPRPRPRPRPYYGRGRGDDIGSRRRYPIRGVPRRPYYRPIRRRRPVNSRHIYRRPTERQTSEETPKRKHRKDRLRPKDDKKGKDIAPIEHENEDVPEINRKSSKSKSFAVTPITPYAFTTDQLQLRKPPKPEIKEKSKHSGKERKNEKKKRIESIDRKSKVTDTPKIDEPAKNIELETRQKSKAEHVETIEISKPARSDKLETPSRKVTTKLTEHKTEHKGSKSRYTKGEEKLPKEQDRPRAQPSNRKIFINPLIPKSRRRDRDRALMQAHRLRSKVTTLSNQILVSMETVLRALRSKVNMAYQTYDGMFNVTRYDIMLGVRKGLYNVVNTNDEIYGIILDMSRLVRHVYRRAHEGNLFNPSRRREPLRPDIYDKDFRAARRKADQEYNSVIYTLNKIKRQKRRCSQLRTHKEDVKSRLMKLQSDYRLRELAYFSNRTLRQIQYVIQYNMAKRKLVYFGDTLKMARGLTERARNINQMAHDLVTECTLEGWKCSDTFRNAKEKFKLAKERYKQQPRQDPQPTISPEERRGLRRVIDQAKHHALELDDMKQIVERYIYPQLRRLKAVVEYKRRGGRHGGGRSPGPGPVVGSSGIERALQDITHKIQTALQKLKVKIAYDQHRRPVGCEIGSGDDGEDGGSGCDEEVEGSGGGGMTDGGDIGRVTLTSRERDEDDFVFEEREPSRPKEGNHIPFGFKLRRYTRKLRDRSERLKASALRLSSTLSAHRNSKKKLSGAERVFDEAGSLLSQWRNDRPDYQRIHVRVIEIANKVTFMFKTTQSKSHKSVRIVEKKLEEVTKGGGKGGGVFAQVIQSVGKAQSGVKSIQKLKAINPNPCARTTLYRDNIRANLTELRSKIERVKFLTASMKLPVALSNGNYLEVPLKHDAVKSYIASIMFCVKRSSSDGIVTVIPGNTSVTLSVTVEDGFLSLSVTAEDDEVVGILKSFSKLKADQWYAVRIDRYGQNITMSVHARGESAPSDVSSKQSVIRLKDETAVQILPSKIFIGGRPGKVEKKNHFSGCVSEVRFNGRDVNIYVPDSNGLNPNLCSSSCVSQSSVIFDGKGYLMFPPKLYPMTRLLRSVSIAFRTLQRSALLMLLGAQQTDLYLIASMEKGFILVSMTTTGRTISIRTNTNSYSDGQFYTLKISLTGRLTADIDGERDTFTAENSLEFLTKYRLNNLFIGGVSDNIQPYLARNKSSFSGCIRKIELNDREIPVSSVQDSKNVYTGSCQDSIVSKCVSFTTKSKMIALPEYNHSNSVHFMFMTHEAKGYLLNYKRGEKVDLWLRLTKAGIETRETVNDNDEVIPVKNIADGQWHSVILTQVEGEESLVLSIDGSRHEEIDYSAGLWRATKSDGFINITIGGPPRNEDGNGFKFEGNIAHFHIENRPVDLTRYAKSNNLDGCRMRSRSSAQSILDIAMDEKVC